MSKKCSDYLNRCGIQRRYTAQQNGVSQRKNRKLLDMGRCMLLEAKLPEHFWAEAINTAVHIRNRRK